MISKRATQTNGTFIFWVFKLFTSSMKNPISHSTGSQVSDDMFSVTHFLLTYSGIHGRPYREWGNATGTNNTRWQGYCTHTSILFAPWHRPYVSLFEVTLQFKLCLPPFNLPTTHSKFSMASFRTSPAASPTLLEHVTSKLPRRFEFRIGIGLLSHRQETITSLSLSVGQPRLL